MTRRLSERGGLAAGCPLAEIVSRLSSREYVGRQRFRSMTKARQVSALLPALIF